jgi:hypothetical protein
LRRRDGQQGGFAMLLVFVMAATVAIMLYRELPRVAFEAQRSKEELLIDRGEEYSRAIQLYVRKWKKYPGTMEELESTNQVRFLRKRYNDPMTGKSEWRVVHVGPGGVFTDSVVHKPPSLDKKEEKAANTFIYEAPTTGSTVIPGQTTPGFQPTRPSERAGRGMPGLPQSGQPQSGQPMDPSNPQAQQQPGVNNPNQPGAWNPLTNTYNPVQPQQPGVNNPNQPGAWNPLTGTYNPAQPQQPGTYPPPGVPGGVNPQGYPAQQPGVNPLYPAQPVNSQTGGVSPYPYSTQPGAQGTPIPFPQPGTTATPGVAPGQNQALSLINQILTTPRAVGLAGTGNQPMAGLQIGGGIAGVASTVERMGIKIYNEKEKYNEWEFLYDITKDKTGMGAAMGAAGMQQQQQNQQQGLQNQGTPVQSPFGQQNGPQFPGGGMFGPQQQPVRPR